MMPARRIRTRHLLERLAAMRLFTDDRPRAAVRVAQVTFETGLAAGIAVVEGVGMGRGTWG